jgi:hypothetical protein
MSIPSWGMKMKSRIELLEYWSKYFLSTEDYESKIWDFPEKNNASEFLVGDQHFRSSGDSWWITLVDSYKGRKPFLWNREFFLKESLPIYMIPTLLLDSQIVNELHKYVMHYSTLEKSKRSNIRKFLTFFHTTNYDISPLFYSFEALEKSDPKKREGYIRDRIRTIFLLQTMDVDKFRETGEVSANPSSELKQLEYHKARSLEDYINNNVQILLDAHNNSKIDFIPNISYACLVKMAIVHKQNTNIKNKSSTMQGFFEKTIGLWAGPERCLSIHYFANPKKYQRFVPPLQSGMNIGNFKRKLRSSAWDMLLMRLPYMLNGSGAPHLSDDDTRFSLNYVCTAEHAVRDVMQSLTIETILELRKELGGRNILQSVDFREVESVIGKESMTAIISEDLDFITNRMEKLEEKVPISQEVLAEITYELEEQAEFMCR